MAYDDSPTTWSILFFFHLALMVMNGAKWPLAFFAISGVLEVPGVAAQALSSFPPLAAPRNSTSRISSTITGSYTATSNPSVSVSIIPQPSPIDSAPSHPSDSSTATSIDTIPPTSTADSPTKPTDSKPSVHGNDDPEFRIHPPSSWTHYKTEPGVRPEYFDVVTRTKDPYALAQGYYFLDPTFGGKHHDGIGPWGSQIYDQDGNLVYHSPLGTRTQDFKVCDYLGSKGTHLCYHDRLGRSEWPSEALKYRVPAGAKVVLDRTYKPVGKRYKKGIRGFGVNGHEFNMLPGGFSFLQPISTVKQADLTPYGGTKDQWVAEMCFQEIDVRSGASKFDWCYMDHLPLEISNLYPHSFGKSENISSNKAGTATTANPWDFGHFNSMDKNEEGDYFVSVRHCDMIIKIAGNDNVHGVKPGKVLWLLGGRASNFTLDYPFSKQHSIRHIGTSAEETVISIMDNAGEGFAKSTAPRSAGKVIMVNNKTMKASTLYQYPHPENLIAPGKGNMQILPGGNVVVGWGIQPSFSEFSDNGTVLFHARYTANLTGLLKPKGFHELESSYRVVKFPWIGLPEWDPKLVAYSRTCKASRSSPLVAYVSWNGATTITHWRFKTARSRDGPWVYAGVVDKNGYETKAVLSNTISEGLSLFSPYIRAEAMNINGAVMGNVTAKTFVPAASIRKKCDEHGCHPEDFDYRESLDSSEKCEAKDVPSFIPLILYIIIIECLSYVSNVLSFLISRPPSSVAWVPLSREEYGDTIALDSEVRRRALKSHIDSHG